MSISRYHTEWLALVENSGPFLSLPVLTQTFPQGLDTYDKEDVRRLRMAFEEWDENQLGRRATSAIHRAWIKRVLEQTLGYEDVLEEGQAIPQTLKSDIAEYGVTLRPDFVVNDPETKKARVLVQMYPRKQSLTKPVGGSHWKTSPDTRMMQLLHDKGIRLGIITNGDHWMLVNAPKNETTGYASWYANLWFEEPITLRAFRALLSAERLFGVPQEETLEALLDKSAADQQEVTDQLGYQVRKAVEVLIQSLDKADQDHGRKLLADVSEKVLYEAALTVMMRLVFLFCAEERELLLLGDDLYDNNYAVSTLREQLHVTADQYGEEILGLRYDAWVRLLTTFRTVYAGANHDRLKVPAYGGDLFDPDRFPFLEGREGGTSWKTGEARPLPINNRTILHLLDALQVLEVRLPRSGPAEARRLSFRSLDIEQIGHVYESLLDHTAKRAAEPMLGLQGTRNKEPKIALSELENILAKGEGALIEFLTEHTGRSEPILKKALASQIDDQLASRFRTECQDEALWKRVRPFAGLVRLNTSAYPLVITTGCVYVAAGTDRRGSGTYYTPRSLTEPIVQYTLEPLVFVGPAEGLPKEQWKLRSPKELLDLKICDMACGSGAFLVQACRYMAARVLEAWEEIQRANPGTIRITPEGQPSTGEPREMLIPDDLDERQTYAMRIVAQRCLYGVDKNPLAVEMAKLSLWLLTLAKDKPFEFLDHAIRCGDSLVGIHNLDQLQKFNLQGIGQDESLLVQFLDEQIRGVISLRKRIAAMQANSVSDVEVQGQLLSQAEKRINKLKYAADLLLGAEFLRWEQHELIEDELRDENDDDEGEGRAPEWLKAKKITEKFRRAARTRAAIEVNLHFDDAEGYLSYLSKTWLNGQRTFHWPLEFPEVVAEHGGFHAFVCNPPFMAGTSISTAHGHDYAVALKHLVPETGDRADLAVYFLRRAYDVTRPSDGSVGLVATNSISETDSRLAGLSIILANNGRIPWAVTDRKWPGKASLTISTFCVKHGLWQGVYLLNGLQVGGITSFLDSGQEEVEPHKLICPVQGFTGSKVYGDGFILSRAEGTRLLQLSRKNTDVVRPYWDGDQFNNSPSLSTDRYIINFSDMSRKVAEEYREAFEIVRERVMPLRMNAPEEAMKTNWWQFQRPRQSLYSTTKGLSLTLVRSIVSKHHSFGFVEPTATFSHAVVVIASDSYGVFAILQSSVHEAWSIRFGSKHETRPRYTISDCFHTFPFPPSSPSLDKQRHELLFGDLCSSGKTYYEHRGDIMKKYNLGFTDVYNLFHDPKTSEENIAELRHLHIEIDNVVIRTYGWSDLILNHGFHETKQGIRFTISESARRGILAHLLRLNHERYEEEVHQGLHNKKNGNSGTRRKKKEVAVGNPDLFD